MPEKGGEKTKVKLALDLIVICQQACIFPIVVLVACVAVGGEADRVTVHGVDVDGGGSCAAE